MPAYPDTLLLIDGSWRPAASGRTIPVVNPATGQAIGAVAWADRSDLDAALAAAARGFEVWRKTSAYERAKLMRRAAEILRGRVDEIAVTMTLEQGKPLAQARQETQAAADIIDWFAGEAQRTYGQVIPARSPDVVQMTLKLPVGPVAAFTPWNFPINQVVRKLSAALATGCSIIVKAPEETPAAPAALIRAFVDAGIPAGVIGLVYGVPAEISEYLIPHPVIRKISFTGSTPVGKQLAALAGLHMKRATMELGGHAPVIVAEDADLALAVDTMVPLQVPQCRPGLRLADPLSGPGPPRRRVHGTVHRRRQGAPRRQRDGRRHRDGAARQRPPHPGPGSPDRRRRGPWRPADDRWPPQRQ